VRLVASDCLYNNRKAERELGYRPSVSFQQGLADLANELRAQFPVVSRSESRHAVEPHA
jgi:nucleoside-diphosphate-sugar epimerase